MPWQYTPYTVALILAALGSGVLALYIWQRRHAPGATSIVVLMAAASWWSMTYALQLASADLATEVFFAKLEYFGIVVIPVAGLAFALQFSGRAQWLKPRNIALLFVIPIITVVLIWTNEAHELIWRNVRLESVDGFSVKVSEYGPWFYVTFAYAYLLMLTGIALVVTVLIVSHDIYRRQAVALLIFALSPMICNTLYVFGLNPFPYLDLTPFAFNISGLALAWGLFRFRLADLIPVAYSGIIESMDDSVIVLDSQDRIIELNAAAKRLMGGSNSNAIGQPLEKAFPELADRVGSSRLNLSHDDGHRRTEVVLGLEGSQRIYDARISRSVDQSGLPTFTVIALRETTRYVQAEEELRTSEERYRNIFESIIDVYGEVALDGTILEVSPSIESLGGYTREELVGTSILDYHVSPDKRTEVLEELLQKGKVHDWEFFFRHKNGQVVTLSFNVELVKDEDGTPIKTVGVMRDVTERKHLEEELITHRKGLEYIVKERTSELREANAHLQQEMAERREIEEKLRQSEERYRTIFELAADSILLIDADTAVISEFNDKAHETLGYTREEFQELDMSDIEVLESKEEFERHVSLVRKHGADIFETKHRTKSREIRDVLVNCKLVSIGERRFIHAIWRDITEQKQLESRLLQSSKLAAIGELATGVAHEINNPLAVIDVQTGLAHEILEDERQGMDQTLYGKLEEYFITMEEQVRRCQTVTESLLSFARMPIAEQTTFQINNLLRKTVRLIMPLTDTDIRLEMLLDDNLPLFHGDMSRLQQVFVNILTNAVKSIDDKGSITIATSSDDTGFVRIEFKDSGKGIPPEIKDRIFDPFFTTRPEGQGTGLGLSMSYFTISGMNGQIDVESTPGEGTTFTVVLPKYPQQEGNAQQVETE